MNSLLTKNQNKQATFWLIRNKSTYTQNQKYEIRKRRIMINNRKFFLILRGNFV